MKKQLHILSLLLALMILLSGCGGQLPAVSDSAPSPEPTEVLVSTADIPIIDMEHIPEYAGSPFVEINGNIPEFSEDLKTTQSSEYYVDLDQLGRCGPCFANIGSDLMPTEPRESISSVHPSGWMQKEYDCVEGGSLYNRCHLIGFQLTGENANDHNLITGTRYLNVDGMLPFENQVADYIRTTGNHVLYRVTPVFEDSELVARGVQMEALSVEDGGAGICFNVYCYNVQPGILIDYQTGDSRLAPEEEETETVSEPAELAFVLNTNTHKFHDPGCSSVGDIAAENRQDYTGTRQQLLDEGYTPCGRCKP